MHGYYAWDIDRLIVLTQNFKHKKVPLDSIREIDENFWFGSKDDVPTCQGFFRGYSFDFLPIFNFKFIYRRIKEQFYL